MFTSIHGSEDYRRGWLNYSIASRGGTGSAGGAASETKPEGRGQAKGSFDSSLAGSAAPASGSDVLHGFGAVAINQLGQRGDPRFAGFDS